MIKSNIDLTSNEMFSRASLGSSVKIPRGLRAKWIVATEGLYRNESFYSSSQIQIVLTGNREERTEKRLCLEENSGNHCDCCGGYLLDIPWDRTYGLCRRCQKDMDDRFGNRPEDKMPWLKETAAMRRRGHNPLIW